MYARTVVVTFLVAVAACTAAPEPPPTPQAVVALSQRYDQPNGSLDEATAREIVDWRLPRSNMLKALAGLTFLRDVIADGTTPDVDGADLALNVQGSLGVHAPCPGWGRAHTADGTKTGFIDLTMGVDASRVQRAFTGRATDCRFSAQLGGERVKVSASMAVELDLGRSLGLGEPVPSLLLRFSELSTALSTDRPGELAELGLNDLDEVGDVLSLRVGGDDLVETLIELDTGTFLLALREDGSVGVRGRDSQWVCSRERSHPCERTR